MHGLDVASDVVAIVRDEVAMRTWKSFHFLVDSCHVTLQVVRRITGGRINKYQFLLEKFFTHLSVRIAFSAF